MGLRCEQGRIRRHDQGGYRSDVEVAIKKPDHEVQALVKEKADRGNVPREPVRVDRGGKPVSERTSHHGYIY